MKFLILNLFILFSVRSYCAANPLDYEGCPDNSHCSKETGERRLKWLSQLKNFTENKINETTLNQNLQKTGIPFTVWLKETDKTKSGPFIFWDSPCKQHKTKEIKINIAELFLNEVSNKLMETNPEIIFSKIYIEENGKIKSYIMPRGDAPLSFKNNSFYFTKEDEGHFYGMYVNQNGALKVAKTFHINNFPKEVECPNSLVESFKKNSPTSNFYNGYFCKEIYNEDKKSYMTILTGWSCN